MKPEAFHTPQRDADRQRQTILIAGASGLIGTAFTRRARELGHTVRHLVRRAPVAEGEFAWNPASSKIDHAAFSGVDTVINLSGASISKMPWTKRYRDELRTSRLDATNTLVTTINGLENPPTRLLSGSAVGIYGNRGDDSPVTEQTQTNSADAGFLEGLCTLWEDAARQTDARTPVTLLRTGLVLGTEGGMLPVVTRIAKLGGAGPLGSGRQHWPWISLRDYTNALLHLMDADLTGPVNLVSPTQTTAAEFMRTLAHVVHRPYLLPAPAFALKTLLGDAADELLLSNQPVVPERLLTDGFAFADVDLADLLRRLLTA